MAIGGEPLSSDDSTDALRTLNLLIQDWKADGLHLWSKAEGVIFMAPGQASYSLGGTNSDNASLDAGVVQTTLSADALAAAATISVASITGLSTGMYLGIQLDSGTIQWTTVNGAPSGSTVTPAVVLAGAAASGNVVYAYTTKLLRPTRVLGARRRIVASGSDIPITLMERPDYFDQPTKTIQATVTMVYYDPQLTTGKLYVWTTQQSPVDTIRITFERPLEQVDDLTNTMDVPQEWLRTLVHCLAADLAPKHSLPLQERVLLEGKATSMKSKLLGFDREYASVIFQPDFTQGGGYDFP